MGRSLLLGLELSQGEGGVAAACEDGREWVRLVSSGDRERDQVMPAIDAVVREAGCTPQDIHALAVSTGPGGFTGLRIAVATAKMIAVATGAVLLPVETSAVVAAGWGGTGTSLVVLAVKRGTFWLSRVEQPHERDGDWIVAGSLGDVAAIRTQLARGDIAVVLADEHLPAVAAEACDEAGVSVLPPTFDPRALVAVAQRRLARGAVVDASLLLPIYPREPEAVRKWKATAR